MKGRPFGETQKAVSIFLDQLDRGDFVSLLSFGTEVKFLTRFTKEKHQVREQIEPLRPVDQWTHLYDGTYEAIKREKEEAPTTRTAVILLTDGKDERSTRGRKEAVDMATGASIPVFTLGFGHKDKFDEAYLEEIARVSGGHFLSTPEPERIADLYTKVLDQLKNQYRISFDFAKEPGNYKANLTLSYQNKTAEAGKEFLFNPAGGPVIIHPVPKPWYERLYERMTKTQLIILGSIAFALALASFIFGSIYIKKRKKGKSKEKAEEEEKRRKEIKEIFDRLLPTDECQLEFPEGNTVIEHIDSKHGSTIGLSTNSQNVFLKVDCLKKTVPLVFEGVEVITELIIARKQSEKAKDFRKEDVVYLWASNTNTHVSRPDREKSRPGHARIFFSEKEERFAVEDLGSKGGTLVRERPIKVNDPVLLQDGDVIDVGGKQGMRIVYRESEPEKESYEETTIGEL